jgi:hypothetical protein
MSKEWKRETLGENREISGDASAGAGELEATAWTDSYYMYEYVCHVLVHEQRQWLNLARRSICLFPNSVFPFFFFFSSFFSLETGARWFRSRG